MSTTGAANAQDTLSGSTDVSLGVIATFRGIVHLSIFEGIELLVFEHS